MGGTAGLSEAEIKAVKHRQEYEKHVKAKEGRLDRHSGEKGPHLPLAYLDVVTPRHAYTYMEEH